jgi:anaerobic magnesium-protoporphyrin IX monomethyl ester cyclase
VKVLLVHPARGDAIDRLIRLPPLGLACVAGALRAAGHEVRIVDAAVRPRWERDLATLLTDWRPQAAGISASTAVLGPALAVAATVKEGHPEVKVILGGVHATLFPAEVVREGVVDYAVHGEGERTAVELLAALDRHEPPDRIPGIAFRDGGRPRVNGMRALVADLD